jgi:phytoene dehydrogenase-like protein
MTDVIIIGGGMNGLVAAACLARHKRSVVVLDRRPTVGGAAVTGEFAPGFRAPTLSHALGPIDRDVVRALALDRAGLEFITPDPTLTSLGSDERTLVFHRDPILTAASIARLSSNDASRWRTFVRTVQRIAAIGTAINRRPAPSIDGSAREWWPLVEVGRRARKLGRRDLGRAARWMPMAVADLAAEWFESDLLQAAIAAHAVFGNPVGPWSAGTGAMYLARVADDPMPLGSGVTVRGGPGVLTARLADIAREAGATVRTDARVARVLTTGGQAVGVALENGEEFAGRSVLAAIDPKQTFLELVDPADLAPTFRQRIGHYRARGSMSKVNLALSDLPAPAALHGDAVPLAGRFLVAPDVDYLERAHDATKYGGISPAPWLEWSIPTIADPGLAPDGRHVMSIYVHFTPIELRGTTWSEERDRLYRTVIDTLEPHIPGIGERVVGAETLTPEDLAAHWGTSGGHVFHGEPTLDQAWLARPLIGWARHASPIGGLFMGSAGTHPGGGLTGLSGLSAARTVHAHLK